MAQEIQHFKLLTYMKKPKPWRKVNNYDEHQMRCCKETRNVDRICRQLMVNRAPSILLGRQTPRVNRKKCHKRKAEPPFLIRNCISGLQSWENYTQKMLHWSQKAKQRKQNRLANSSFAQDQSQLSYDSIQPGNMQSFTAVSAASTALLRTFYTVWHIGRLSRKSLKTNKETITALKQLSVSPVVEKCLQVTPKGGITAKVITDKSQLSKRALQTLSRWARMTEEVVQDGYESGYDDDPVEIWNRAITLADASCAENELNNVTKTTDDATFSTTMNKETPKRRSNRLLKSLNSEI